VALDVAELLTQIRTILDEVEEMRERAAYDDLSGGPITDDERVALATRCLAAIVRLAPDGSEYVTEARAVQGHDGYRVLRYAGILRALEADVEAGFTRRIEELVHAEVFEDFLEMATELHAKGYHPAAAVVAGSVLEEHLRKLAQRAALSPVPRSVEDLGVALRKAGVVTEPERKIVQGWYGQRTEGAHGRPNNVIPEEVGRMIPGVREFMVRHPA
jgi:hypothetical protein